MQFNLEELLLNEWMEKRNIDNSIMKLSNEFETFLRAIQVDEHTKAHLSNIKSEYGSLCEEFGFKQGYRTALEVLHQLSIL
ncbi:hypothetical protein [Anaerostipes caccae]|uniref:hypothetical protein n=1 Tax=Anaerostipes caccae TaxID=105841 RepID=UPI0022E36E8B|nr:hypothetical protein [Anaerostipes caccae]